MLIRVLMENSAMDERFVCEHGLSLYIEAQGKKILFDAGQTMLFSENAEQLGVEETTFTAVVDAVGVILTAFGIVNNPTNKEGL